MYSTITGLAAESIVGSRSALKLISRFQRLVSGQGYFAPGFALVLSLPVSYYLLKEWLEGFAYSINLELWFFMLAGFLAIDIALIVTGSQAVKASLINPCKCLRSE